jgi:hypothetical protein
VIQPPFSLANFALLDTKSKVFGHQNKKANELSETIIPNSTRAIKYLTDIQSQHVPSPRSLREEIEKKDSDSDQSDSDDYEDMMDQEKAIQRLVELLQAAINENDKEAAAKHAGSLAASAAKVAISLDSNSLKNPKDTDFR